MTALPNSGKSKINNVSFFDPKQEAEVKKKRLMAEYLMKGADSVNMDNEMVSGIVVKKSPIEGLAKALQTGLGGLAAGQASKAEGELDAMKYAQALEQQQAGYDREDAQWNREAALKRELAGPEYNSSSTPAAVLIADEIAKARSAGDMQRVNDLLMTGKMLEKGVTLNADNTAGMIGGYTGQLQNIEQAKQTGSNISDLQYKPQIANEVANQTEIGKQMGEANAKLNSMEAQFPRLEQVASELSALGKTATYTKAGQLEDIIQREAGQPVGPDAVARKEYIAKVDNEVLPLLRQTFGAAFTQKEGDSLKATLGDTNASPEEKDAVLRSFIQQKSAEIETLKRQTGQPPQAPQNPPAQISSDADYDALPSGTVFIDPEGKSRRKP